MAKITSFEVEYNLKKRKTHQEKLLKQTKDLLRWKRMKKKVRRYNPKVTTDRHLYALSITLHVHCMQLHYNISDSAMKDALYQYRIDTSLCRVKNNPCHL